MENQSKTEIELLKMVFDLMKNGYAEELQDIILDGFSGQLKDQQKGRIHELNQKLKSIEDVLEIVSATQEDGKPLSQSELAELQVESIVNIIS